MNRRYLIAFAPLVLAFSWLTLFLIGMVGGESTIGVLWTVTLLVSAVAIVHTKGRLRLVPLITSIFVLVSPLIAALIIQMVLKSFENWNF